MLLLSFSSKTSLGATTTTGISDVTKANGPVLQFTSGVGFSVDVAGF